MRTLQGASAKEKVGTPKEGSPRSAGKGPVSMVIRREAKGLRARRGGHEEPDSFPYKFGERGPTAAQHGKGEGKGPCYERRR